MTLAQETLDYRRTGFSPVLSLLMSAYSLVYTPAVLTLHLLRVDNAPLPSLALRNGSKASVSCLAPLYLRRGLT
jgi:hypothetical protein